MKKNVMQKNGSVEFLRFLFCMFVLFFHMYKYIIGESPLGAPLSFKFFAHGAIGVEFFFLLSGLLMARHVDSIRKKKNKESLGEETSKYVFKKFMSVFPYHIIAFIIIFILTCVFSHKSITDVIVLLVESIPGIFLIQMSGFKGFVLNHIEWYLSSLLIGIAIVYPLLRKYYDTFIKYVAPLIALLIIGYLYYETGKLTGVMKWMGLGYKGTIRGIAELLLGIYGYYLGTELSKLKKLPNAGKVLLTILEGLLIIAILIFANVTFGSKFEFYALIVIFILLILSYSGITYSGKLFNNKVVYFLGKLSLPIYVSQLSALLIVENLCGSYSIKAQMILMFVITIVLSLITMFMGDTLNKKIKSIDLKKYYVN